MYQLKTKQNQKNGFTLVELLVVMAILAILATVSLANFQGSQIKARDAQRKADLRQISHALEAYLSDHGSYPAASPAAGGMIKACDCGNATPQSCDWTSDLGQREFCDVNSTVYMVKVPGDPKNQTPYCYKSSGTWYQLYAMLENERDAEAKLDKACGAESHYNFGISSANIKPSDSL